MIQVVFFLADLMLFVWAGACLLRLWCIQARVSLAVQPGPFVMALTDWVVMPLRRVIPAGFRVGRLDPASLVAFVLAGLVYALMGWFLVQPSWSGAMWMGGRFLLETGVKVLMYALVAYAVLSWVQPHSTVQGWLHRLVEPLVHPWRQRLPRVGGVDISVFVVLVLLQVALMGLHQL